VEEAVDHLVAYSEWLERKVKESQAAVARGETVPDEEVRARVERPRASVRLRVDWSLSAVADLKTIVDRTRPGSRNGKPRCRAIYDAIQSLRTMPYRGRYGRLENTRELVIPRLPYSSSIRPSNNKSRFCW
jgi:hypothetical protein